MKPGDIVWLKEVGTEMKVVDFADRGEWVCIWTTGTQVKRGTFPERELTLDKPIIIPKRG